METCSPGKYAFWQSKDSLKSEKQSITSVNHYTAFILLNSTSLRYSSEITIKEIMVSFLLSSDRSPLILVKHRCEKNICFNVSANSLINTHPNSTLSLVQWILFKAHRFYLQVWAISVTANL